MMVKLKNERHERFAQACAMGKGVEEAFQLAGYREKGAVKKSRLQFLEQDEAVQERIAVLEKEMALNNPVTVEVLTKGLLRIARDCEESDTATAKNVARSAYMDIAKLNGLLGDRSEGNLIIQQISEDPLDEDEWAKSYTAG